MKREQRQAWIDVDQNCTLCTWCRFMEAWRGCTHPLVDAIERSQASSGMEPGDPCWGFRPNKGDTVEAAAARAIVWQADLAGKPNRCPVCSGPRHWAVRDTAVDAVCEYCGRRGAFDNLTTPTDAEVRRA